MSNIRDLGSKINSLKNMQKVMRAMNMIASIKLRKLYAVQDPLSLFTGSVDQMCSITSRILSLSSNPVAAGYKKVSAVHIVMFTADKGLCGTHNSSVQKAVAELVEENEKKGIHSELTCIGNKGIHYCSRREFDIFQQSEISERVFTKDQLRIFSRAVLERFINNRVQRVYAVGNIFYSTLRQETETRQLLPFYVPEEASSVPAGAGSVFSAEPDGDILAEAAADRYLFFKLQSFLLNSYLSEHSSRMTAMENATNNSEDLINKYVSMQNHARQAAITGELIEIVSGKEALKG